MNPNAVMQKPITIEDYLNARYIAEPLRLFDYCLINDGGVAIILRRADMARDLKQRPCMISGFGWSELNVDATQLRPRLKDFYHPAHRDVADAGLSDGRRDAEGHRRLTRPTTASACICSFARGLRLLREGEGGAFIQDGRIEIGGELPCNTSGGMLSESYMQSWNHQVELVRQLRGGLGARQVEGAEVGQYVHDVAGKCLSIIYTKEAERGACRTSRPHHGPLRGAILGAHAQPRASPPALRFMRRIPLAARRYLRCLSQRRF